MTIAFLHLSDIHIEDESDWILSKSVPIAQTVCSTWADITSVFVLVTGDISNRGQTHQYELAREFLSGIRSYLEKELGAKVFFVLVPGNHDLDLTEANGDLKGRDSFIDTILSNPNGVERGDSLYLGALRVQKNFFAFCRQLEPNLPYPSEPSIFYQFSIETQGVPVVFNCYNSAWLSKLNEDQGKSVFPLHLLDFEQSVEGSVSISLYHHPENWLQADNANSFKKRIEQSSDVVLVGHEHHREVFTKIQEESGENVQFIRAEALQVRPHLDSSAFSVVLLDVDEKREKIYRFKWNEGGYSAQKDKYNRKGENDWKPFLRNRFLQSQGFVLLPEFEHNLNLISALPLHSRKANPTIDDLFVAPHLQVYSFESLVDGKRPNEFIKDDEFFSHVTEKEKHIIYGDTFQGKTTLAKRLYLHFRSLQVIPLMVNGSLIAKVDEDEFERLLKKEFGRQYDLNLWERFKGQPKEKVALIVDDFGQSNINQQRLQDLLVLASKHFKYVIAFAHSNLRLQQQVRQEGAKFKLSDYTHSTIRPLTPSQRAKLIRSWVRLDADYTVQDADLIKQEDRRVKAIESIVEVGLIWSYPFFIFGALLLIEGQQNGKAQSQYNQLGSFGFIYEGIITQGFAKIGKSQAQIYQIGLLLSQIAHFMFKREMNEISLDDLTSVVTHYNQNYGEQVHVPSFLADLESARIFVGYSNNFRFSSPHLRDYYVAKHYASALNDEDESVVTSAKDDIKYLIQTVIHDPHTRVLLFLVYEANNSVVLVRQILGEAQRIFAEYQSATLEDDVRFLESLTLPEDAKPLQLGESVMESRDEYHESLAPDEEKAEAISSLLSGNLQKAVYSPDLDDFLKAAIALKMIEITGQLVKTLGVTIKKELKQDLIHECISIGLRFLRSNFEAFSDNLRECLHIFSILIKQKHPELRDVQATARSENIISFVHEGVDLWSIQEDFKLRWSRRAEE